MDAAARRSGVAEAWLRPGQKAGQGDQGGRQKRVAEVMRVNCPEGLVNGMAVAVSWLRTERRVCSSGLSKANDDMSDLKPILMVEDEENDITIMQAAFADLNVQNPVRVVRDGEAALRYLEGRGEYLDRAAHPAPGLMLLDLNLPGMSGFAVLRRLCRQQELKTDLRVIVMTSLAWADAGRMVKYLGADEFLEKPIGYGLLKERVQGVLTRWGERALPAVRQPSLGKTG